MLDRVLVVDDFGPFRSWTSSFLQDKMGVEVIAEAFDGEQAVQKAQEMQPELVVLEVGLPTLNGIEAAKRIRQVAPESKIVFLSQETSPDVVEAAMRSSGALAYVTKDSAATEFLEAIEAVLHGEQYVSPGLRYQPERGKAPRSSLSDSSCGQSM